MASHYHLPIFHSLSFRKLTHSSQFLFPNSHIDHRHNCRYSTIFASSLKKSPRASRKLKSDEDLCNELREFLSTAGFPENHVPTTKELSNHGRQDLANIVRRRGHKLIKQLLEISEENCIGSNIDTGQTGGQNEKLKVLSIDVLSNQSLQEDQDDNLCIETDEELQLNDQSSVAAEFNTLSLQEKVADFIEHGKLEMIEDSEYGSTYEQQSDEEGNSESETSRKPEFALSMLNGTVSSSAQNEDSLLENSISRNTYISTEQEQQTSIGHDEDLDDEEAEEDEIKRLKFLLHQKELELTQLKQQIEKEKHALSLLQTKAEKEISKAQELISEKETELLAAEETLSGLKDVEIQYSGDGETVELAGSFNGWHHKIQMEPQLSLSNTDPSRSRISRIWRVVLWLYPGVYEIKFIIDGHWRIDPQTESVTRNGVHNNILRVE